MKKEPKKPEVKQESNKEHIFLTVILCLIVGSNIGLCAVNGWVVAKIEETNLLLSTFQRIDTVREEPSPITKLKDVQPGGSGRTIWCNDPQWVPFEQACGKWKNKHDPQSDPNLCQHIETTCKGTDCHQDCVFGDDDE